MISVPRPRVLPLGSFDTVKDESAVDSLHDGEEWKASGLVRGIERELEGKSEGGGVRRSS